MVERLDVKRALLERVDAVRRPGTIVSSNTSGISIAAIAEGRSDDFRRHWLGTHFFNPPRYLRLLELIPTPATDPAVLERVRQFADHRLGKGVVVAKDTPNFIANHIGVYGVLQVLRALDSGTYTIEEIDAITGPALGRPNSATFRTMDIAGIDILAHVAANLKLSLPAVVMSLIERGWIGEKSGQGFYKREKTAAGSEILTLDPATLSYRAKQPARLPSLDAAQVTEDVGARIKTLITRRRQGRHVPPRHARPDAALHGAGHARDCIFDRRCRSRDAMGIRLGPRAVRDHRRDRDRELLEAARSRVRRRSGAELLAEALAAGRNRFATDTCRRRRRICRFSAPPRIGPQWSDEIRAPAWSISATACWRSSSTRR